MQYWESKALWGEFGENHWTPNNIEQSKEFLDICNEKIANHISYGGWDALPYPKHVYEFIKFQCENFIQKYKEKK